MRDPAKILPAPWNSEPLPVLSHHRRGVGFFGGASEMSKLTLAGLSKRLDALTARHAEDMEQMSKLVALGAKNRAAPPVEDGDCLGYLRYAGGGKWKIDSDPQEIPQREIKADRDAERVAKLEYILGVLRDAREIVGLAAVRFSGKKADDPESRLTDETYRGLAAAIHDAESLLAEVINRPENPLKHRP